MKISEQNSLRVLLLAITLTILGGAIGIMFYASQYDESVLASNQELLAVRVDSECANGFIMADDGTCVPDCSPNQELNKSRTACIPKCSDNQTRNADGQCVEKIADCPEGYDLGSGGKCLEINCESQEWDDNGKCIIRQREEPACSKNETRDTSGKCIPKCSDNEYYDSTSNSCLPKIEIDPREEEKEKCLAEGRSWDDQTGCYDKKDSGDIDGDGIPNSEDPDIDNDGYLNDDDLDAWHYNVGDRDILMFATLAYEPVSASQDKISGDTMTGNGRTVKENYYRNNKTSEPVDTYETGYPDYFNYVCSGERSIYPITAWNNARDGKNPCMIDEDTMIGMQSQNYNSEIGQLLGAWQTPNKDFFFGDDGELTGQGAELYKESYEARGLGEEAYKGYASIEEVNQWLIVDHVAQRIKYPDNYVPNLTKNEGIMQATVFRLNNNFVIAYRGTDFPDVVDWISDATYASNSIKGYEDAAQEYATRIVEAFSQEYFKNPDEYIEKYGGEPNFYITGHSLGGYLAPVGAIGVIKSNVNGKEFLRDVVYFNGMGVGLFGSGSLIAVLNGQRDSDYNRLFEWAQETDENGAFLHKVMCYSINGDPVSALGRHINQTGYYSAEGAIKYHASEHEAFVQKATRSKILEAFINTTLWGNPIAKALGEHGEMYNRLDDAKDYMEYYSDIYGDSFSSLLKTTGSISLFDIFFFCHEPSASLFYNISQGTRGYKTQIHLTTNRSGKTIVLTSEVNGDVESYAWYKDGNLIGTSNSYSFVPSELSNGTYTVSAVVKTRESNKEIKKVTVTETTTIDETAPRVIINTEGGVRSIKSGGTVNFIVRVTDSGVFRDEVLTIDELGITGTILNKYLKISTPVLLSESTANEKVYKVSVTSSAAGAIALKVKSGAFVDTTDLASSETKSPTVQFTIFKDSQEDKTRPTVKIMPETTLKTEKGQSLRFRVEGFDEEGIKDANLKNNSSFTCAGSKAEWEDVVYSSDRKTAYSTVTVSCNDSTILPLYGVISIKAGAFIDNNENKNAVKLSSPISFTAPDDRTAPFVKITSVDGWKGTYGGSLKYVVTINDDSGVSDESTLEGNIDVLDIRNGITITNIEGPKYNNNKTVVSYTITVSSNEHCSKVLGCGGTFAIKAGAFKDSFGNGSLARISGNIAFASERDIVSPTVKITAEGSRSAEVGDSLNFKVIVKDAGGIDTSKVLKKEDFTIVNKGDANIYVDKVSEPTYNSAYTQAEYIVTVKGDAVSSNIQLSVKNGAAKDNAGNSSSSILSDFFMFIKRPDLTPPTITITPVTNWSAIKGNELKFVVKAKDDNKLSKNKTVTTSSFYMTKLITNDVYVKDVSPAKYSANDTEVSYTVTVYATKTGKARLSVKPGVFKDNSNNSNLLKLSEVITYEDVKDTTPPSVSIKNISKTSVKQGNMIELSITVSDAGGLSAASLTKDNLKITGNDKIAVKSVERTYKTNTEASWRVKIECTAPFGFGQLVRDAVLVVPKGLFRDGNKNGNKEEFSSLLRFTKY